MIINHEYKFIFLKTRKTAGTSIEIALSKYCGADDTITPISDEDELMRQKLGLPGPQNFLLPFTHYGRRDWQRFVLSRGSRPKQFYNHAPAKYVKDRVPPTVWASYFKFAFERDPFDKAISSYYFQTTRNPGKKKDIADFLRYTPTSRLSNWDIYTINDEVVVDYVGRYETLAQDLALIKDRLGLPGELDLPRAKSRYRKNREHYTKLLDAQSRKRIEIVCAKEMAALDYRWMQ